MKTQTIVNEVVEALEAASSRERVELSKYYFPTSMRVIGSTNPDAREVIKGLKEKYKELTEDEWIHLCIALVKTNIFECQGMAYELIGKNNKLWPFITLEHVEKLKRNLDNWASVDGFAVYVCGVQWRLGTVSDAWINALLKSKDHWERRLAVVSTVALNLKSRGGTGDVARTIAVCEQVVNDKQDMVVKALSWALRELSKRERDVVSEFIEKHRNSLAKRVLKEVSHKLEFGTKN